MRKVWSPGRVGLGGAIRDEQHSPLADGRAEAVLEAAWDAGIRFYDTAPHHGLGRSERRLGQFLAGRPRADVVVSTKVGRLLRPPAGGTPGSHTTHGVAVANTREWVWDFTGDGIRRSLESSLVRLGLDRVDLLLLHDPDKSPHPARALAQGTEALVQMQGEGLVERIGVGSRSTRTLLDAASSGAFDLIMAAGRFTLWEWADEVVQACWETDTGILATEGLPPDLLSSTNPAEDVPDEYRRAPDATRTPVGGLAERCRVAGTDVQTAALLFPLRNLVVQGVVLEPTTPGQVAENADKIAAGLSDATWDALLEE